jgi:hypothetical protein
MDYHMVSFLTPGEESGEYKKIGPCQISLLTMGTKNKLSVSNSPHLDSGNVYSKCDTEVLLGDIKY